MKDINWATFPFVDRWLPDVGVIQKRWPNLAQYNPCADWHQYQQDNPNQSIYHCLRNFRQSRLAYLAVQDALLDDHLLTLNQVTQLADCLLQQALHHAENQIQQRMGVMRDKGGHKVPFAVFALGKMGTGELNYSSDIDLVFVSGGQGRSDGQRSVDSGRYFEKLGRLLIQLLDEVTDKGRVYRVDMRLRPFGTAAPLVCTSAALQNYIITEGRAWERFAWMRARFVAGDESLAADIQNTINPFIYRRHLDFSVFDSLARVKREMQAVAQNHVDDIKLGEGGIREIEFIVQSLQVTFGGRHTELQGAAIAPQFKALEARGQLSSADAEKLMSAWLFLRRLENLCQLVNDQQTHLPPDDQDVLSVMAKIMGMGDWQTCKDTWRQHRQEVSHQFKKLFSNNESDQALSSEQLLWVDEQVRLHIENKVSQDKEDQLRQLLERASTLASLDELDQQFVPIVLAILRRPSYVLMLNQESSLLPRLLKLTQKSTYFTDTIKKQPALMEQLFEPEVLPQVNDVEWYISQWQTNTDEEEQWLEAIRFFKQRQQFTLMAQRSHDVAALRQGFSDLAESLVHHVVAQGWRDVVARKGDVGLVVADMVVIAYGSLGVKHMSLTSDLDLVLVIDVDELSADQRVFAQRWGKRINHLLTVRTYHGVLYDLDLQLRPNGNSGALVTSRKEFASYQKSQAWVWEHAALIKARLLNGQSAQRAWFYQLKKYILTRDCDEKKVLQAMKKMSEKLDQFGHKNHEIELSFLTTLMLGFSKNPELLQFDNYVQLVEKAVQCQLIEKDQGHSLLALKSPI